MSEEEEYWPERIIAQHAITYYVPDIRADMAAVNDGVEPTLDEVIEQIYMYVKDDFSCGFGHLAPMSEIVVFDPDGEEY